MPDRSGAVNLSVVLTAIANIRGPLPNAHEETADKRGRIYWYEVYLKGDRRAGVPPNLYSPPSECELERVVS